MGQTHRTVQAKVAELRCYERNPRRISTERLGALKASLEADRDMLHARPLIALPDGRVVCGNMRLRAAQELGWKTIPTVYVDLDEVRARKWVVLDNNGFGEWDDTIGEFIAELARDGVSIELMGFDQAFVDDLLRRAATSSVSRDPDATPPAPKRPKSKPGEVYELGAHRLICGDSTNAEHVQAVTGGATVSAVVTDPPYGIEREGIANDDPEGLRDLFDRMLSVAPLENAVVVAFQSPRLVVDWIDAVRAAGHRWERLLWLHRQASKTYPWRGWVLASDAIAVSSVGRPAWPEPADFCHDTYVKTELEDAKLTGIHTTIKPSWVIRDLMAKLPDGPLYEPFAGSGTAIIAAEQLGRPCFAIEVNPGYCDVIRKRYADFTDRPELAP